MFATPPEFIPINWSLRNYTELFNRTSVVRWLLNSTFVAGSIMVLVCFFSSLAGYAFAKLRFVGRDAIFYFMISLMMLPKYVLMVPLFRMMIDFKWFDTYWGLIIPEVAVPFGVFLMRQFMMGIPTELIESAKIDGCNEFSIYWRILLPLMKPALAALAIFEFVKAWNDYVWQLIIIKSEAMRTLPLGVAALQNDNVVQYGPLMAGATLSALPMIILFIAFQKYFTRGITLGAVKG